MPKRSAGQLEWGLAEVMAKRGITSPESLQLLLRKRNIQLSDRSVRRLFKSKRPKKVDIALLSALVDVFACSVSNLLRKPERLRVVNPEVPVPIEQPVPQSPSNAQKKKPKAYPKPKLPDKPSAKTPRPVFSSNVTPFPGKKS
jgi:hypothetical protein